MLGIFHVPNYQKPKPFKPFIVYIPNLISISQEKNGHQTWPKTYLKTTFQILCSFKKRIYGALFKYHFLVIVIVGFDDFKGIPSYSF